MRASLRVDASYPAQSTLLALLCLLLFVSPLVAEESTSNFEEWETDVLGIRLFCETVEMALVETSIATDRESLARRKELETLWLECETTMLTRQIDTNNI